MPELSDGFDSKDELARKEVLMPNSMPVPLVI